MIGKLLRPGLVCVGVLLAACTVERPLPAEPTARLFARGLDEITDLYIEPISSRTLVLSGAARLSRLDPGFSMVETPAGSDKTALVLSYRGADIGTYPTPPSDDSREWGVIVGRLIADAKKASPRLAAMSEDKIDKAIFDGMTGALDRFSRYSPPDMARDQRAARDGFGGIGITLEPVNDQLQVAAVTPHGPAERAGIRPGDRLLAIGGRATAGRAESDVIHQLRGPIFTTVDVTVARGGTGEQRNFRMQRELIVVPTVTMSRDGTIAIIHVASFNESTTQRLTASINEAEQAAGGRLTGIVLDLRGNPGGLLDQAVALADVFLPKGPIVSTVGRNPASRQFFSATGEGIEPRTPVVVLINGGSASASEIVAAALQDAGRAVVVGSSSYGKGTVQTVIHLPNDGELTLTWARLISPSGYALSGHGVVPTLCTSALAEDDARSFQLALQRVAQVRASRLPRASLNEKAWADLRNACPARQGDRDIDVKLAERVLSDPALYSQTVRSLARAPEITAPQQAMAPAAALTATRGGLSSGPRVH
ncbi:MAG TPA: S41 family peptidase [Stellaceae bacterium]|nr:S41 family peptidase [Stellaceae bacterium]